MRDKNLSALRDEAIRNRFRELFEVQRLRLDDVMATLSREFYLAQNTINHILKYKANGRETETSPDPADSAGTAPE